MRLFPLNHNYLHVKSNDWSHPSTSNLERAQLAVRGRFATHDRRARLVPMVHRARVALFLSAVFTLSFAPATTAGVADDGYQQIRLPSRPGSGVEERVLLDDAHVELATITLRRGTELRELSYSSATTIQALHGNATVRFSDARKAQVGPGSKLALAGGQEALHTTGCVRLRGAVDSTHQERNRSDRVVAARGARLQRDLRRCCSSAPIAQLGGRDLRRRYGP